MEALLAVVRDAQPKLLVLYHQPPGSNEAGLQFLRADYDGRIVMANDLDVFQ